MTITIYHNPRCSKSRETLALLEQKQCELDVQAYLNHQFTTEELQSIAKKLGVKSFREMMRTKDELFATLGLNQPDVTEQQLLDALVANSALLERPIVVNGERAKIGRPPESVLEIL
ncbi:arsenate reductase [Pasteurella multocida]|uniref:Arsenate reductase n=1 Tax=Pasteurella dagmatis ATCC 43325 TaxID=667128 RepID=C9PMC0_9PAST|nr:arsenate reductase (glutaredoxin) [Pasteurella dagmatis]EEX51340.1 arsenate reductase [Pasteurella dagmatis ATCC 43325]SNV40880.1 arsenate reductase [Pasteurella dagmatis]VEI56972.1 arsenate reductase [Pasteurella multocida]